MDADWIVTNAAGCGATLRDYGHLLGDDPRGAGIGARVRDVSELLAEHLPGPRRPLDLTVTYHEPCHLAHGQRVREAPRAILRAIPGLRLVDLPESDLCCGSAGVYNLMEPEIAGQLLERKLISEKDTHLYKICKSPQEGVDHIKFFYSTYHSMRFVRDRLVIRLEKELDDAAVRTLAREFSDLVKKGAIEKTGPLHEEANEPELDEKPRLAFTLNRQSASRLHEMILAINEMGRSVR